VPESIFIGVPTMGTINTELALHLMRWNLTERYQVKIYFETGMIPISAAQNSIVAEFLSTDYSHLFLLESDVIPPPNRICRNDALDLVSLEVDAVDGLCFICERGAPFNGKAVAASKFRKDGSCLSLGPDEYLPPRLIEVDVCGAGCLMIKRKVLETLKPPYFKFECDDDGGVKITQDYFFAMKAKKSGFGIHIHSGFQCLHQTVIGI